MSDRHELQAQGTHPAPCARHCESTAYEIEIRRLRSELAAVREDSSALQHALVGDTGASAILTADKLRSELATSREREAWMRAMIADDGHAMTFQSLGQYRTSLLRALAEGAQG